MTLTRWLADNRTVRLIRSVPSLITFCGHHFLALPNCRPNCPFPMVTEYVPSSTSAQTAGDCERSIGVKVVGRWIGEEIVDHYGWWQWSVEPLLTMHALSCDCQHLITLVHLPLRECLSSVYRECVCVCANVCVCVYVCVCVCV